MWCHTDATYIHTYKQEKIHISKPTAKSHGGETPKFLAYAAFKFKASVVMNNLAVAVFIFIRSLVASSRLLFFFSKITNGAPLEWMSAFSSIKNSSTSTRWNAVGWNILLYVIFQYCLRNHTLQCVILFKHFTWSSFLHSRLSFYDRWWKSNVENPGGAPKGRHCEPPLCAPEVEAFTILVLKHAKIARL